MSSVNVKIIYAKGISLSISNRSFREAMKMVWLTDLFKEYEPLKLIFSSTGKVLYMDKSSFMAYLSNEISQEDLIKQTQCDNLYRNKIDLTMDNQTIDAGSLWKSNQNKLHLVDSDDWLTTDLNTEIFESI